MCCLRVILRWRTHQLHMKVELDYNTVTSKKIHTTLKDKSVQTRHISNNWWNEREIRKKRQGKQSEELGLIGLWIGRTCVLLRGLHLWHSHLLYLKNQFPFLVCFLVTIFLVHLIWNNNNSKTYHHHVVSTTEGNKNQAPKPRGQ